MLPFSNGRSISGVPIPAEGWKRAIFKRPPKNFHVQLLPPEKHGNSYNYGFRIHAIKDDNASTVTRTTSSGGSSASPDEYDVWRKWEDCLFFQDSLEVEYSRAAREKRRRLAAGKGVKKNGVYIHSDEAASWESLPFGPDPNDIAYDIHEHIPKLTKKGTFFRASKETIDNRYEELRRMMYALLQDDLPTLIKEIKSTSTFTDFFGLWRRDVDLAQKTAKKCAADRSATILSTNTLSTFTASPSSLSVTSLSPTKGKAPEQVQIPFRTANRSDSSCSEDSVGPQRPGRPTNRKQNIPTMRSRGSSSDSHASSSLPSTPVTASRQLSPTSGQPNIVSQEMSVTFDHNPYIPGGDRRSSFLESLPEDRELPSSSKSDVDLARLRQRPVSNTNRNAKIYAPSPSSPLLSSEPLSRFSPLSSRVSLQPVRSSAALMATSYLDELGVDYCLPSPIPETRCRPRASISSMASVMTNSSVDAVIPRSERPSRLRPNNAQRSLSHSGELWGKHEPWSEDDSEDHGDILDAYFSDLIRPRAPTPDGFSEMQGAQESMYHFSHAQSSSSTTASEFSRFSDRRASMTTMTSRSSGSTTSSSSSTTLSIKAVHEDNIIMLRVPRYTTFAELRPKIYDKFTQTSKSTISESFAIALLEQPTAERTSSARSRAGSVSSFGSAYVKGAPLHFISSQDEWDDVVTTHGGKMLLRIIGSRG